MHWISVSLTVLLLCDVMGASNAQAQSNGDINPPLAGSTGSGGAVDSGSDAIAQATAQANAQAAVYNAQAAAANANKAAIDAKTEAAKAAFGSVPGEATTPGGSTSISSTSAPLAEATLLVTLAAKLAASDIARQLAAIIGQQEVILLTDTSQLSASDAMQFDLQVNIIKTAFAQAKQASDQALSDEKDARKAGAGGQSHFAPAIAGAAIDATAKLLTYFQTDYAFAGVQVTEPSNLTAGTVAAALRALPTPATVTIPSNLIASDAASIISDLSPLEKSYIEAAGTDAKLKALATSYTAKNPAVAAELGEADAQVAKATASYESFMNGLNAAPQSGSEVPIVRIVRAKMIQSHLSRPNVHILLVIDQKIAENYTKKNLWTFFGGPPLYTMGGISSVYILYNPSTGQVEAAGAIPRHGGYRSVNAVQKLFP